MNEPRTPEVEVLLPEESDDTGLPVLAGHQVTYSQWEAFEAYCRAPNSRDGVKKAAKAAGVAIFTFYTWRRSEWWKILFDYYMRGKQQDFHRDLLENSKHFSDAMVDVAKGNRADDKSAGAAVNAALGFAKMGPAPLIDNRSQLSIEQNITNTTIEKADIQVLVQNMSQEQLLEYTTTGRMPAGVSPKVPDDKPVPASDTPE